MIGDELAIEGEVAVVHAMRDFQGQLPNADLQTWRLAKTYRKLCTQYNDNSPIRDVSKAYKKFSTSIFYPVAQLDNPEPFLEMARRIFINIQESIDNMDEEEHAILYRSINEYIIPKMRHRIDLARLDKNIFQGLGISGTIHTQIPSVTDALRKLTGRVFEINVGGDAIISTASGTVIQWNDEENRVNDLINNSNVGLNSVLTCAHAIGVESGRSEFYFIPSRNLNLSTGLPIDVSSIEGLVGFLRNSQFSFYLDKFIIKNRVDGDFTGKIDLIMGQPHYKPNEDLVIGNIKLKDGQNYIQYDAHCDVHFQDHSVLTDQDYFALGYPTCHHHDNDHHIEFVQDLGVSPVFITKSQCTDDNPVGVHDGMISHHSPAAKGMSGGPLFHLRNDALNIFGVITAGEDENEEGCYWL